MKEKYLHYLGSSEEMRMLVSTRKVLYCMINNTALSKFPFT
jgi:hypothetical protein